jgi:hypothetical protein
MKKVGLFVAALALAAAPSVAQALPAIAPLAGDESEASGGNANIVAAAFIAGIVAIAVIAATDGDDRPVSA